MKASVALAALAVLAYWGSRRIEPVAARTTAAAPVMHSPHERLGAERGDAAAPGSVEELAIQAKTAFEHESIDTAWSRATQHHIGDAIRAMAVPGASLERTECRTTLCRVEMHHASDDGLRTFNQKLMIEDPLDWKGSQLGTKVGIESDGRIATVMYLSRDGYELPAPR